MIKATRPKIRPASCVLVSEYSQTLLSLFFRVRKILEYTRMLISLIEWLSILKWYWYPVPILQRGLICKVTPYYFSTPQYKTQASSSISFSLILASCTALKQVTAHFWVPTHNSRTTFLIFLKKLSICKHWSKDKWWTIHRQIPVSVNTYQNQKCTKKD